MMLWFSIMGAARIGLPDVPDCLNSEAPVLLPCCIVSLSAAAAAAVATTTAGITEKNPRKDGYACVRSKRRR